MNTEKKIKKEPLNRKKGLQRNRNRCHKLSKNTFDVNQVIACGGGDVVIKYFFYFLRIMWPFFIICKT